MDKRVATTRREPEIRDIDRERRGKLALNMYRAGLDVEKIAKVLEVSDITIKKQLEKDLHWIDAKRNAVIVSKAYEKAMKGDSTMIKFILSSQCGWSEKKEVNVNGEIGLRPILNISLSEATKTKGIIDVGNPDAEN